MDTQSRREIFNRAVAADVPRATPVIVGEAVEFARSPGGAESIVTELMLETERVLGTARDLLAH